jgi:hypothetical protein
MIPFIGSLLAFLLTETFEAVIKEAVSSEDSVASLEKGASQVYFRFRSS